MHPQGLHRSLRGLDTLSYLKKEKTLHLFDSLFMNIYYDIMTSDGQVIWMRV